MNVVSLDVVYDVHIYYHWLVVYHISNHLRIVYCISHRWTMGHVSDLWKIVGYIAGQNKNVCRFSDLVYRFSDLVYHYIVGRVVYHKMAVVSDLAPAAFVLIVLARRQIYRIPARLADHCGAVDQGAACAVRRSVDPGPQEVLVVDSSDPETLVAAQQWIVWSAANTDYHFSVHCNRCRIEHNY